MGVAGMKFMLDSLRSLGTRGSKLIRLDAFGYATKTPGTRCFFQVRGPCIAEPWGLALPCTLSIQALPLVALSRASPLHCSRRAM